MKLYLATYFIKERDGCYIERDRLVFCKDQQQALGFISETDPGTQTDQWHFDEITITEPGVYETDGLPIKVYTT